MKGYNLVRLPSNPRDPDIVLDQFFELFLAVGYVSKINKIGKICFQPFLTHESSVGRLVSHCNRIVLLPWRTNMHCESQYACERESLLDAVAQLDLIFGLQFKRAGGWYTRVCVCSLTKRVIKVSDN